MSIPTFVSPAKIESELSRIWDSLQGTNKMRACLFNLILYTKKNSRTDYIRAISQKVIEKFPSRVILIAVDDTSTEDYLRTGVSVLSAAKGEYDIVCDLIEIDVAGQSQERIPFLILPHLLPDLPVYVLWAEDPTQQDAHLLPIENFAQRVIFDSESTDNLPLFAETLLHHHQVSRVDIADLNWARLESWRDLLSTTFYAEDRLEQLQNASKIEITYNAHATTFFCHTQIQSIYLQAWIGCQLGWTLKSTGNIEKQIQFTYQKAQGEVVFLLTPNTNTQLAPGAILSVDLLTEAEEHFSFARNARFPHQVGMEISTPIKCDIPIQFIFAKAESGQSLVKEICHKGSSLHYLNVLKLVKGLPL